ncbi:MAG TPA: polysaccharide biosynthesis tyrosine autokinase [Gemmatales bacterium]|nr:polysaccharide biosynthesis tyrosine autokinase [Gemmatales bacterium]
MNRPELLEGSPNQTTIETQTQHQEAAQQSNIYRIAWQRKSLLILGLMLALVIGVLYYSQKDPVYQSLALISVQRKNQPLSAQDPRNQYVLDDPLNLHMTLLRTQTILNGVVQDNDIKKLETFVGKNPSEMLTIIATGLIITRDSRDASGRSPVIQIAFKGPIASDCQTIITAVIKHYKEYLKENYQSQTTEFLTQIRKAENMIRQDYDSLSKKHLEFLEQNAAVHRNTASKNPMYARLEMLESNRIKISEQKLDIESRLSTLKKGIDMGYRRPLLYLMTNSSMIKTGAENNSGANMMSTSDQLMKLELTEKLLANKVGKNHPELKEVRMQIESLSDHLTKQTQDMVKKDEIGKDEVASDKESPIQSMQKSFVLELIRYENMLKTLDAEIAKERDTLKDMSKVEVFDQEFQEKKTMMFKLITSLAEQANSSKVTKDDANFTAETISPPTMAIKVEPKLFVIMILSSIFGLLGGFGLAYLADLTDKSFRSPEEIRRRLNIPVIGHIPILISEEESAKLEGAINGPDPTLVTYYRPKSRKSEVFRGIRTAIYFSTRGESHKVIQITSPNMGDGKTTLSSNLAVSIAQSGKQTILIDGDFRRPRLHKVFAVPSEKGFATALMGQADLRDCIQPTVIPGLSLLPCGPIPPNPAELLTSPRFKELMDELREQYDYVLIDTPPLLVVTDPCVVAPRVDGVLMTMRVTKNGRPIAERARDILVSLGAKPLGIIVNGVSMQGPTGYGFGYGYGYGYGYGQYDYAQAYQYKYDYSDRYYAGYGDEGYYQDRDATDVTPPMPHSDGAEGNRLPSDAIVPK